MKTTTFRTLTFLLLLLAVPTPEAGAAPDGNVDLPRFPALSPDGREVLFSWHGDLWKVPVEGGTCLRLTSHPAEDERSAWSADGSRIAFESSRSGWRNIHLMNADGTGERRLTVTEASCSLAGFDGDRVLLHALTGEDLYREPRPYSVSFDGGDLVRVHGAFGRFPRVAPDHRRVLFTRGGSPWSRRHYRGPDARDVWMFDREDGSFTRLTGWAGNDGRARWAGGDNFVFLSDREDDCVNLYRSTPADVDRPAVRLTRFTDRDVTAFDVSADGALVVFTAWDTLYRLDLTDPGATPVPLVLRAASDAADERLPLAVDRKVSEATLSPDGQVLATVAYGDVFLRHVGEDRPTRRVTHHPAREKDITWSPDGTRLYFTSDRDGTESIYAAEVLLTRDDVEKALVESDKEPGEKDPGAKDGKDEKVEKEPDTEDRANRWQGALTFSIAPVVVTSTQDRDPRPSPDGKWLAFRRGLGDLALRELSTGTESTLLPGWDAWSDATWSPDSRWLAVQRNDLDFNTDIWMIRADGSAPPVNVTRHPDNDWAPRFSADGRILAFLSERTNEETDVWMVHLDRSMEALTKAERGEYYEGAIKAAKARKPLGARKKAAPEKGKGDDAGKDEEKPGEDAGDEGETEGKTPAVEKPFEPDLEDAWRRVRRVTDLPGNEGNLLLTPGGDRYVFSATVGGEAGLWSVKWDGTDRKKIADPASVRHGTLSGDKVVLVSAGRAATVPPAGGKTEYLDIHETIAVDPGVESSWKFREAARIVGEAFYHPTMKGLDWPALTQRYHDLARRAHTPSEFSDIASRLLGELNGSHLGIRPPGLPAPARRSIGRLGIDATRVAEGFRVDRVLADGPSSRGTFALKEGDVLLSVNQRAVEPRTTLDMLLEGAEGEILVKVRREGTSGPRDLDLLLVPVSTRQERSLRYRDWRRSAAALVDEWSGGRLGYIHVQGMDQDSLDVFERDLNAAMDGREGLVIDVRNNGGGWTTDRLLASIMVRPHAYTIPRGADPEKTGHYPQDRLFIQRCTLPMNLLCNEKSFSNAEILSHAFKTLGRGTLVGRQTYGGVISTGGTTLVDGTFVRIPFRGWFLPDGTDMENHGAVPDLQVLQTPQDESRDEDAQLRAAVTDLLQRL